MRAIAGFVLACGAAYSASCAIDLFLGSIFGIYPATAHIPVVTWTITAWFIFLVARWLHPKPVLTLPFALVGGLALLGAMVGPHPINYGIAIGMFVLAAALKPVLRGAAAPSTESSPTT